MFSLNSVIEDIFAKFAALDLRLNKLETYEAGITPATGNISMDDNLTSQVVNTTPTKLLNFQKNGPSLNTTPDYTNNQITIDYAGTYLCISTISFSGDPNDTYELYIRVNGVESDFGIHRKLGAGGDIGAAAGHGPITLAAGDIVTVYVQSDDAAGSIFLPSDASLTVMRLF